MTFWHYLHAAFLQPSDQVLLRQHAYKYRDQMHPSYLFGQGYDFSRDGHDAALQRKQDAYRPKPLFAPGYPVLDTVLEYK